jgi:hypothetical protein
MMEAHHKVAAELCHPVLWVQTTLYRHGRACPGHPRP